MTADEVCVVCGGPIYWGAAERCTCSGSSLRAEIERLRAENLKSANAIMGLGSHVDRLRAEAVDVADVLRDTDRWSGSNVLRADLDKAIERLDSAAGDTP